MNGILFVFFIGHIVKVQGKWLGKRTSDQRPWVPFLPLCVYLCVDNSRQCVWLCWQSGGFRYKRSGVRIVVISINNTKHVLMLTVERKKTKQKEAWNGLFFTFLVTQIGRVNLLYPFKSINLMHFKAPCHDEVYLY